MKRNTNTKLKEALDNAEAFIAQMKTMEDKKLSKHIDLYREQMEMAYRQGNSKAYELLYEYEKQTIIARAEKI
jgi:predicted solute-binding protein